MSYVARYETSGYSFAVTDLLPSFFERQWAGVGPTLCLTKERIADLSDEEIVYIVHQFENDAAEIDAIQLGSQCGYDEQFISRNQLLAIIDGKLADLQTKKAAREEIFRRDYPSARCQPTLTSSKKTGRRKPKRLVNSGWVYIISAGSYYKIGQTKNLNKRYEQISPKLPFPSKLLLTIKTDNSMVLEAELHKKYAQYNTNGEWFELPQEAIDDLRVLSEGVAV